MIRMTIEIEYHIGLILIMVLVSLVTEHALDTGNQIL